MRAQSFAVDRQGKSTCVGDSQVQREIPIFSALKDPQEVPHELVVQCKDELAAINLCINLSGFTDDTLCDALGIDPGHWSRIRKGRGHFPARKRLRLMSLCGNLLPVQFEAWKLGRRLEPIS